MNAPDSRQRTSSERMITVGRLHGAFGVRGEVKLESFTDPLRAIAKSGDDPFGDEAFQHRITLLLVGIAAHYGLPPEP